MLPDEKVMCRYTGFDKSCFDMVTRCKCQHWVQLLGTNPQTGDPVDRWGCSDVFQLHLLVENSQQSRQTGAAVESFRNEMVAGNERSLLLLTEATQRSQRAAELAPALGTPTQRGRKGVVR